MKGEKLWRELGNIDIRFFNELEEENPPAAKRSLRHTLLAAAIGLLILLMVGCGVAYMLSMEDLSVWSSEKELYQGVFTQNDQGKYILKEGKYRSFAYLSMSGPEGTPGYQANQEWERFLREYDPNHEIRNARPAPHLEIPPEYEAYSLYTQEMVEKLEEILVKYDFQSAGEQLNLKSFSEEKKVTGTEIINIEDGATIGWSGFWVYSGGNIVGFGSARLPQTPETKYFYGYLNVNWYRKDCLGLGSVEVEQDCETWNYSTTSGEQALLCLGKRDAFIFLEKPEAYVTVRCLPYRELPSDREPPEGKDLPENSIAYDRHYMTKHQLELVADAISQGFHPNSPEKMQEIYAELGK